MLCRQYRRAAPCTLITGVRGLAGHSKWHNTRHRKARQDSARGALYDRMGKEIRTAVLSKDDMTISDAMAKARKAGVPKEIIERAVQRSRDRASLEHMTYEGTLGSTCIIIEALTDKRTRTAAEVRATLKEKGGVLGADGCASWAFRRIGLLQYEVLAAEASLTMLAAMDAGAEDVDDPYLTAGASHSRVDVLTEPEQLSHVRECLSRAGRQPTNEQLIYSPRETLQLSEPELLALEDALEALEALEDVEDVWHNVNTS